jgi:CSL zinc finger
MTNTAATSLGGAMESASDQDGNSEIHLSIVRRRQNRHLRAPGTPWEFHFVRGSPQFTSKMLVLTRNVPDDEIEIEDMAWDEERQIYHYPCPCGDRFEISRVRSVVGRLIFFTPT